MNGMKINPSKSKAVRFTRARVKDPLNYSLMDTLIHLAHALLIGCLLFIWRRCFNRSSWHEMSEGQ
jgi:hypothetical protein